MATTDYSDFQIIGDGENRARRRIPGDIFEQNLFQEALAARLGYHEGFTFRLAYLENGWFELQSERHNFERGVGNEEMEDFLLADDILAVASLPPVRLALAELELPARVAILVEEGGKFRITDTLGDNLASGLIMDLLQFPHTWSDLLPLYSRSSPAK